MKSIIEPTLKKEDSLKAVMGIKVGSPKIFRNVDVPKKGMVSGIWLCL